MTVDEYIASLRSPVKEIATELCHSVRECHDFHEAIKWNVPVFSIKKNICSVIAHRKHVNLQIFEGAHLLDASDLQGTGKDMRHLKFSHVNDIDRNTIQRYLRQAISIDIAR